MQTDAIGRIYKDIATLQSAVERAQLWQDDADSTLREALMILATEYTDLAARVARMERAIIAVADAIEELESKGKE